MDIPKQLQNKEFRFVKLKNKSKDPYGVSWVNELCTFDEELLMNHVKSGGNVGISGGYGGLLILDIDDEQLSKYLEEKFNTFTVKTCRNRRHLYFYCDEFESGFNLANNYGEIRLKNRYVVLPGCFVDSKYMTESKIEYKGSYDVNNDVDIKKITKEDFIKVIGYWLTQYKSEEFGFNRSNKEQGIVIKLVGDDKTKEEVFDYMKKVKYVRWNESNEGYHNRTYDAAIKHIKKGEKKGMKIFTKRLVQAEEFGKEQPFFYDKNKIWWLWDKEKFKWQMTDDIQILNMINEETGADIITSKIRQEIKHALMQQGRRNMPEEAPKTWIQFKNRIIDIETDEKFEASPKWFVTNPIPWELGDSEDTPIMDRIFKEWVDEKYVDTLYEILTYCCLPNMPIHRVFCLVGDGLNGKTSFERLIEKFVGEDNTTSSDLDILMRSNFEASKLYRKLVVLIGEIDKSVFTKTKMLKRVTGDDLTRIEFKSKNSFDAHLYAKPIAACNVLPETTDKSIGFFRRWTIIDFPNQFDEKKDILNDIPEMEYNNLARKCLRIIKEILKNGEFTNDGSIENRQRRYEEHSNPISKFIKEFCIINEDSNIVFDDFYNKYIEWLKHQEMRVPSKIEMGKILTEKGYKRKKVGVPIFGTTPTTQLCITGIKWKYDDNDMDDMQI